VASIPARAGAAALTVLGLGLLLYPVFLDRVPILYYTCRVNLRGKVRYLTGGSAREFRVLHPWTGDMIWLIPEPMVIVQMVED